MSPYKVFNKTQNYGLYHRILLQLIKVNFNIKFFNKTSFLGLGHLSWLLAPTDLHLIEKSDTMLHVTWTPPEIFEYEFRDLLTHYRVTIAPVDRFTTQQGPLKNYTVKSFFK